ncbi:8-amino-7-oxononanoate synthase [Rhizobium sp. P38BS-XIX]|uniref:8-amino-7-oxononanoate synthase n=1 Tax=Rhizobium sp. P38BS-XIX TaxID=2726740 RepID=UPI001457438E|nr:8-amino-7-oxononanoate synthase [Rhizobium sp. P38BS-XIX]NLS01596.1 8-amino-7-oxononanoate synthase [Rhizobium sp. P38BS-XIX]
MSAPAFGRHEATLAGLRRRSRIRDLVPHQGADFTSNDYLGLANAPRMKAAISAALEAGVPAGAGGSRLLRGNHWMHEALETEAAAFFATERVLYFGSGFAANVALFSCLPQRGDLIVYDTLIHASARDGISASKAETLAVPHNDVEAFDKAIGIWRKRGGRRCVWIAVESLYSMDGDRAPLFDLKELADRHGGLLVVDEAHATGVFGPGGRGLASDLETAGNVLVLHTCGKALGMSGALLGLPGVLADYMVNRARSFIYSTAPSPLMAAGVREALHMIEDEPERRSRLTALKDFAGDRLRSKLGLNSGSGSQILPIMIGDNAAALRIAERMRSEGFDVRAIRPPTVPEGTARLRVSITLNIDEGQIADMIECLATIMDGEKA